MSNLIYSGYIYLWYDTKAKFYYIGGHKGKVEDRYICSNRAMKQAYLKRPETFRFRVLEYVIGDTKKIRLAEQGWLDMIKDYELMTSENVINKTCRYYNVKKFSCGGNGSANKNNRKCGGWNKGYSKQEILLRNKNLLCFYPLDKPKVKIKQVNYTLHQEYCKDCKTIFLSKSIDNKFCCVKCRNKWHNTNYKKK